MKRLFPFIGSVVVLILISISVSNAQGTHGVVGKIFSKQEAKTLFGKVIGSISVDTKELQNSLSKAGDYVLLAVKNNRLVVCNVKRQPVSSTMDILDKDQTMYVFSTSMVQRLLQPTAATTQDVSALKVAAPSAITVEVRSGVLTLSSNTETLEMSLICPPICWQD